MLTEIWNRLSNLWAFISFIWSRIHLKSLLEYVCKVYIDNIKVNLPPPQNAKFAWKHPKLKILIIFINFF